MTQGRQYAHRAWAAVRLIHVFPTLTVISGSALLLVVAHGGLPAMVVLARAVAVVAGSQVAVGALNDYLDRHDDARYQPDKPLPSGEVSTTTAKRMVAVGIVVCCAGALTFGIASFVVAAIGLLSGLVYDFGLKRTPFSPVSYIVSFLSLLTWIWLVGGRLSWSLIVVYPLGAALLLAAHLANALPDVPSDTALGQRGLAVILGPARALRLTLAITSGAVGLAFAYSVVQRVVAGAVLAMLAGGLVALAGTRASPSGADRRSLQVAFHCLAPAIVLCAASWLLVFQATT